ncbi:DUF3883 domain-containing protein [Alkalihalobacillus trypoxylicola]|uniref:Protein NO VEIN C-terminal domain-containing protein n=1 Tax=Alkalihalobacillus trypoxylicola TaxID=519424 RepID=A0A161PAG0_9BACI|nr:DUF3883 domain-containing protein [Alkalihalobacillus trypoxylicola]KYG28211.1 hypothetical protein AZF04_09940 [Alkalihalobacillus trypoxylicola]
MLKYFIEKELAKIERSYLDSPEKIVSEYNNEIRNIEDYRGRQLLELLQNADDASVTDKERSVLVKFEGNKLIVANNGEPFSKEGILSLMYANLSPKFREQNKIGNKGLGFRSLLSWANSIYIKSEGLSIKFSKDSAKDFLSKILEKKSDHIHRLKELSDEEFPIATLLAPKWVDEVPQDYIDYDTYIVIDCIDEVKEDIENQLKEIDKEIMLFLNNVNTIKIQSEVKTEKFTREFIDENQVKIYIFKDDDLINQKTWYLNRVTDKFRGKDYELIVAYNEDLSDSKNVLYSYFRTDVAFPFPAIVHGTFDLSGNRNQLIKNKENDFLIEKLVELLIDTAIKITNSTDEVDYGALKLLAFEERFDPIMNDYFKFKEKLIEKIKQSPVFPTIAGTYITHQERPVFYSSPYADILPSNTFGKLLLYTEDEKIIDLLKRVGNFTYKYDYFIKSINKVVNKLTVTQKVLCIKFLLNDYKKELSDENNIKPLLLIDNDGNPIKEDIEVFLPAENELFNNMPEFVKLKFLNKEMFNILRREYGNTNARGIADKLKDLNVFEYSFDPVLRRISNLTWKLFEEQGNQESYIIDFLSWLFTVFVTSKEKENLPQIQTTLNVPVLSRDGTVEKADELYFGNEYKNIICEKILQNISGVHFICDYKKIQFESNDLNLIIDFFKWLGVATFPRDAVFRLKTNEQKEYCDYVFKDLNPIKIQDYDFNNIQELKNKIYSINSVNVLQIKLLDEILAKADFEDILVWLIYDSRMKNIIESNTELLNTAKIEIQFKPSNSNVRKMYYHQMGSYFLWKLRKTPWIKTHSGTKVVPSKCCLAKNISKEFSPLIEIPDIDYSKPIFKSYKINREDVEYWLSKIGVPKDFSDFNTSTVYSILLKLPLVDKDGKNAKTLYRQIVQNSSEDKWDKNNSFYKQYMNEGKVYANLNGTKDYFPIKDVYYLDNRMLCEDVIKQFPILELEKRQNIKNVNAILGVRPLKNVHFKIIEEPTLHELNKKFQLDLQVFLPYVYCFRIDKDSNHQERNALKETKIYLCTDIKAVYRIDGIENTFEVNPYEYIYLENDKSIFIKVEANNHKDLNDLKSDFKFCEAIAEVFAGIIKVEENRKDFRELYAKNISKRDATLRSDLDDEKLLKLNESKKWLEIVTDNKIDFWSTIVSIVSPGVSLPEDEDKLVEFLKFKLAINSPLIDRLFYDFNYDDLDGKDKNIEILIALFKMLNLDVSVFNNYNAREINLIDFYKNKIESLKSNYMKKYYCYLYNELFSKELAEKKLFEKRKSEFINLLIEPENSVKYEAENEFFIKLNLKKKELNNIHSLDLSKLFYDNRLEFLTKLNSIGVNESDFESFCDVPENKSLIYFKEYDELIKKFQKTMINNPSNNRDGKGHTEKTKEETLTDILSNILTGAGTEIVPGNPKKPKVLKKEDSTGGGHSGGNGRLSEKQKQRIGFTGEGHVYKNLIKKYGKENVIWSSEYGKIANKNEDGKDGLGYDFKYIDDKGNHKFVEVKSTTGNEIVFYITKDEVNFAEKHRDSYELYIVVNVFDEETRKIINLDNIFTYSDEETFTNNGKFIVENKDYKIKAEL